MLEQPQNKLKQFLEDNFGNAHNIESISFDLSFKGPRRPEPNSSAEDAKARRCIEMAKAKLRQSRK